MVGPADCEGYQCIGIRYFPGPAMTATAFALRPMEDIQEALAKVPPRIPGEGTYHRYLRFASGLILAVKEANGSLETAIGLMTEHSPAWADCAKVMRSVDGGGNVGALENCRGTRLRPDPLRSTSGT